MLPIFPPLLPLFVGPLELALAFSLGWAARGRVDHARVFESEEARR